MEMEMGTCIQQLHGDGWTLAITECSRTGKWNVEASRFHLLRHKRRRTVKQADTKEIGIYTIYRRIYGE